MSLNETQINQALQFLKDVRVKDTSAARCVLVWG
jgi:hypothetical protein